MSVGQTQVLSVHKLRRAARKRERDLQFLLDCEQKYKDSTFDRMTSNLALERVPRWARGVRVRRVGVFVRDPATRRRPYVQFVVEATENPGR